MGRIEKVDDAKTQYHQGLEFEEFHHNNQEAAAPDDDDETVEEDDLYAPPPKYNVQKKSKLPPPTSDHHGQHEKPQAFPPPQHHEHEQETHAFPPVHHDYDDDVEYTTAQQFPPVHHDDEDFATAQIHFSPAPESININNINNQQQYFSAQPAFTAQPAAAGMSYAPTMASPAPVLNNNQIQIPIVPHNEWKTHLFDCMSDPQNAIITFCFPCVTFGQIAEILDSGRTSCGTSGMLYVLISVCIAMPCLISCSYRSKMRAQFGLMESPAPDCLVHCFCEYCALCQEYRELQQRGIDPSIGYYGNVAKMQKQQQQLLMGGGMAPPMQQRMI